MVPKLGGPDNYLPHSQTLCSIFAAVAHTTRVDGMPQALVLFRGVTATVITAVVIVSVVSP